ncbi:MAG: sporulation protein YabP [Clostridia bacterium]|nr:sporulation protein YabP [Clostridia bacterium]
MDRPVLDGVRLKNHAVHIDSRELMSVTGVKDVVSFNDVEIVLLTDAGEMRIEGEQLRITKLSIDEGQVLVEGEIIAMEYEERREQKTGLFSKVFR